VGGAVLDAVLPQLNLGARVPVCGVIAHCNDRQAPPSLSSACSRDATSAS